MQKVENFIPVSRPEISDETIEEVVRVLKSGWLATGPLTQRFEQQLSDYFNGRNVCCVTSNTMGLHAALIALDIGVGDEVITTPLTFAATGNTIAAVGAKPVFVDVDRNTFNIDPKEIKAKCSDRTKAIMPVHYAGIPVDMDAILNIAKEKSLRVIEDSAHAMGASYKERKIGTFGDIQVFSFHPIKNMTTGEGGCVVLNTDAQDEIHKINLQKFHGIDRSIWDRFSKNANCYYDVIFPGLKSNMSDIQAAIGLHQLLELEAMNTKRRYFIKRYRDALQTCSDITLQGYPDYDFVHSGHLFPILVNDPSRRDNFMAYLKEKMIGTTPYYTPLHRFSFYQKKYGYKEGDFPNAEYIGDRVVCIPLHCLLSDDQQDYIIDQIYDFFK